MKVMPLQVKSVNNSLVQKIFSDLCPSGYEFFAGNCYRYGPSKVPFSEMSCLAGREELDIDVIDAFYLRHVIRPGTIYIKSIFILFFVYFELSEYTFGGSVR